VDLTVSFELLLHLVFGFGSVMPPHT